MLWEYYGVPDTPGYQFNTHVNLSRESGGVESELAGHKL